MLKEKRFSILDKLANFLWTMLHELCLGIKNDKIDVRTYLAPGIAAAFFVVCRGDHLIASLLNEPRLQMTSGLRQFVVYSSLTLGFVVWSLERTFHRNKLFRRLEEAFRYSGLEANGKFPGFISDEAIDGHVRRLKLSTQGIPVAKFRESQSALESQLNISVIRLSDVDGDKSRMYIYYASDAIPIVAYMEDQRAYVNGEIPIGITFEGPLHVNIRDVSHMLIAGSTNGGKSNFLKVATTTLVANNPDADVIFLDFKEDVELGHLLNYFGSEPQNFYFRRTTPIACEFLAEFGKSLEARLKTIAAEGVASLDDYLKKKVGLKKSGADATAPDKGDDSLKRTYLIIDEIGELYSKANSVPKDVAVAARAAINRIARQGRAAGVHLIAATQTPDSTSFDQSVKANLPGVLCFPMGTHSASVSAMGSIRACALDPEVKGRAVWKFGPKILEVQTYHFQ